MEPTVITDPYVARIAGRREAVHRLADDLDLMGRCHTDESTFSGYVTAAEFARIAKETPRRLCGHCFGTVD